MNLRLLRWTVGAKRARLLAVAAGLAVWGFLMPVIYATFGADFRALVESGVVPQQFARFGSGDVFSLPGAVALGFVHPIAVALLSVFAVGYPSAAVAGERQRGTLEVLLARPLSRRSAYATYLLAALLFLAVAMLANLAGTLVSARLWDVIGELETGNLPLLWLNGMLLFGAFAAIGLAASVSFDRLTPALGLTLAVVIVSYFLEVLGSLWPDARDLQPYSLFHYFQPRDVLTDGPQGFDLALLASVTVLAVAYALIVFPRRDLAAPS